MQREELIASSVKLLVECDGVMDELEDKCCVPGRSPNMAELRRTIATTRGLVESLDDSPTSAEATVDEIADAGSQIGRLQVTCCAPARMPLYDDLLHNLMEVQRSVKSFAKLAH